MNYINKDQFYKKDYLLIPPGKVFSDEEIKTWCNQAKKTLPKFSKSFSSNNRFNHTRDMGKIKLFGMPIQHRLNRGVAPNDNPLFGKRAVLQIFDWEAHNFNFASSIIENKRLIKIAKSLIGSDNISFHNGSLSASYPGYPGVPSYHSDTVHFATSPENALKIKLEKRYQVNFIIYLVDVDKSISPLNLIQSSYLKLPEVNNRIAKLMNKPANKDHFSQSNNCYPEMFPELLKDSTDVIGERGSVICLNTGALHRETQNTSTDKPRYVIILSYTENIPEFKRSNFSKVADIKNINRFCLTWINVRVEIYT